MYTFYIDDELAEGLKRVKDADGVNESEQIRRALKAWFDRREARAQQRKATSVSEKSAENRVRRLAAKHEYRLCKGRGRLHINNHGEYQLVTLRTNAVVLGADYDASLSDIEHFLSEND